MRNTLSEEEMDVLEDYLEISKNYFEYGSSETTLIASKKYKHLTEIFSVTSEPDIYNNLINTITTSNVKLLYIDINGGKLGIPQDGSKKSDWPNYPDAINLTDTMCDLVLLNGRFRVAAAARVYEKLSTDGILLVHDFNRASYAPISILYKKIKMTKTLAVFQKKSIGDDLYNKYKFNYE